MTEQQEIELITRLYELVEQARDKAAAASHNEDVPEYWYGAAFGLETAIGEVQRVKAR